MNAPKDWVAPTPPEGPHRVEEYFDGTFAYIPLTPEEIEASWGSLTAGYPTIKGSPFRPR